MTIRFNQRSMMIFENEIRKKNITFAPQSGNPLSELKDGIFWILDDGKRVAANTKEINGQLEVEIDLSVSVLISLKLLVISLPTRYCPVLLIA